MKDPSNRTKVVIRHLPPSISMSALVEKIDGRFAGRYDWMRFCPGKNSLNIQRHSRAYLNFGSPEDVLEFAEFFNGHTFVNEKGAQFKVLVEYAPSQHVPKLLSKKDGRGDTIFEDPKYLEFLELISKPVEHLPSAEIQLERKEAERAGAARETVIVTPLMDFVRQKRAAKIYYQRPSGNAKGSRRMKRVSGSSSSPLKHGSEKHRRYTSMYVTRDTTKNGSAKDKPSYILVSRREEKQPPAHKSFLVTSASGIEALQNGTVARSSGNSVASGTADYGKSKIVFLKGREREVLDASADSAQQHDVISQVKDSPTSKQNQLPKPGVRIIRGILSKELSLSQSCVDAPLTANVERDKRPPRPCKSGLSLKDYISTSLSLRSLSDGIEKKNSENKIAANNANGSGDKHDKRTKIKNRPDHGVWAPLHRSDRSQSTDETLSSESTHNLIDCLESITISKQAAGEVGENIVVVSNACVGRGSRSLAAHEKPSSHGGRQQGMLGERSEDVKRQGGADRHGGHCGPPRGFREVDMCVSDGKNPKKGFTGYGAHEVLPIVMLC